MRVAASRTVRGSSRKYRRLGSQLQILTVDREARREILGRRQARATPLGIRSEEHTSELQSH